MTELGSLESGNKQVESSNSKRKYTAYLVAITIVIISVVAVFAILSNQTSAGTVTNPDGVSIFSGGSCCRSGGATNETTDPLELAAIEYYKASGGDTTGLVAAVDDFGCHQEISLTRSGTLIKRYGYSGGTFYDITP
jgi:hypothetical protein